MARCFVYIIPDKVSTSFTMVRVTRQRMVNKDPRLGVERHENIGGGGDGGQHGATGRIISLLTYLPANSSAGLVCFSFVRLSPPGGRGGG